MSRVHDGGRRCQVCHRWGEIISEESYGPAAGFCFDCARLLDEERVSRHLRLDRILSSSLCGYELTAGDARALGIALTVTAADRLKCSIRMPKKPCGPLGAHYSRGRKQCDATVIGWSQGRFYCEKHYPPIAAGQALLDASKEEKP